MQDAAYLQAKPPFAMANVLVDGYHISKRKEVNQKNVENCLMDHVMPVENVGLERKYFVVKVR